MRQVLTAYVHKGESQYVAECLEVDIITQGETIETAIKNLQEAVDLYFEDERIEDFHLSDTPSLLFSLEVEGKAKQYVTA